jgi:hypothetical protein
MNFNYKTCNNIEYEFVFTYNFKINIKYQFFRFLNFKKKILIGFKNVSYYLIKVKTD